MPVRTSYLECLVVIQIIPLPTPPLVDPPNYTTPFGRHGATPVGVSAILFVLVGVMLVARTVAVAPTLGTLSTIMPHIIGCSLAVCVVVAVVVAVVVVSVIIANVAETEE